MLVPLLRSVLPRLGEAGLQLVKLRPGPLWVPVGVSIHAPPHVKSLLGVSKFNTFLLTRGSRHNPKGRIRIQDNRMCRMLLTGILLGNTQPFKTHWLKREATNGLSF